MEEFAEIEQGGFKIEFAPHKNGGCVVSLEPSNSGSFPLLEGRPVCTIGVVVNANGKVLELRSVPNSPFLRTYATYLVSDREGLFGRICPSCRSYFRTNCLKEKSTCPYCGLREDNGAFTTENQERFMALCCRAVDEAMVKRVETSFDLGEVTRALPNNRPGWVYTENNQQHTFSCSGCRESNINIVFNILGEYGNCPSCGKRNYRLVFKQKIDLLDERFKKSAADPKDARLQEEDRKDLLSRSVSLFDSVANDMCDQILRLPATPKRKNELRKMSFQNIRNANLRFKEWYGFEILAGFSEDEASFIHIMFNRRHLVIHNECRVDQKYLDDTKDIAVVLNQAIRVQSQEIGRLIELVRRAANNLIGGYESFQ